MLAEIERLAPRLGARGQRGRGLAAPDRRLTTDRTDLAEPYASEVAGDAARAVRLWDDLGLPYEAALAALAATDEDLLRDSVARLDALGAKATARIARQILRAAA